MTAKNDSEMLELADFSYAMEMGMRRLRIVIVAEPATCEAGVLQVIEQYLEKGINGSSTIRAVALNEQAKIQKIIGI